MKSTINFRFLKRESVIKIQEVAFCVLLSYLCKYVSLRLTTPSFSRNREMTILRREILFIYLFIYFLAQTKIEKSNRSNLVFCCGKGVKVEKSNSGLAPSNNKHLPTPLPIGYSSADPRWGGGFHGIGPPFFATTTINKSPMGTVVPC